ncbi:hypothetical protein [Micromonospora halophytica]|uniref:Zinc-finger n=1 Tax=Micromonospora halophytica TaxID=47864 RepID=A0A1C5HPM4_9ACTN|nr:hypothetical protein [Micromonospora halophytica]SCG47915.1 hypothetical protein GA0070560_105184 [Micromonospora halophytica]
MTTGEFSEVDHDLLADYLGGALDGTPEEATVARLVEEDPAWADAYATLAPAVARVSADLGALATPAPEMPTAVVQRLTAALAGAGPGGTGQLPDVAPADRSGTTHRPGSPVLPTQGGGAAPRTPGSRRDDVGGPGRRRRRWARLAAPTALAAASVVAVGFGVGHLLDSAGHTESADSTAAGPAAAADQGSFRVTVAPQRSGIDWTPESLSGGTAASVRPRLATEAPGLVPGEVPGEIRQAGPGGLDRLGAPDALDDCLAEVSAAHGRGPITVELLDYAAFRGEPALVLRFADPSGERWAWVSGAECGVPGSGADTRHQARVG